MKVTKFKGALSEVHRNSNSWYCHQIVWNIKITTQIIHNTKEGTDGQTATAISESLLAYTKSFSKRKLCVAKKEKS